MAGKMPNAAVLQRGRQLMFLRFPQNVPYVYPNGQIPQRGEPPHGTVLRNALAPPQEFDKI